MRRFRIILATLVLALAVPATTLGVTSNTAETLQVNPTISLTGVPATLAYAAVFGGANSDSATINATIATNNPTGWTLSYTGTDLNAPAQTAIPSSARSVACQTLATVNGGACNGIGNFTAYTGAGMLLAGNNAPQESVAVSIKLRVAVPATAVGTFTGTSTFTMVTAP